MDMDARREKLMLNQKLTLSLKPMLMPTMAMVVMEEDMEVTVAVMEDMVDTDTDVNDEVPLPKLMLKPMPTMAMVVVMDADMEVTAAVMEDMVDTDTDVNDEVPLPKLMLKPMPTMAMVVMEEDMEVTVVVMEDMVVMVM